MVGGKTSEVVNLFETDEYAKLCGIMNDWYESGYMNKDIQTQTDAFPVLTKNDAALHLARQILTLLFISPQAVRRMWAWSC